ncbi:MAG TPA: DUF2071 domain-containing protein [Chthoniobacterales bacterium]|nr:DUF2071 domain-containing protein [Chthoniobacterales bacterium]
MSTQAPDLPARLLARSPDGRRPQLMYHRWEALVFLHWRVPAARIQETLPKGLTVDTFDGDAYLGVVPFFMRNVRPVGWPALPWISHFLELNVRTYAYDEEGVPGVWFYSLDCDQPLAVIAARLMTGLPYMNAEMSAARGEFIDYTSRRSGSNDVAQYRYRGVGADRESAPESFEFFVLERYYLFARRGSALVRAQVAHAPYRFREAEVETFSTVPAHLDGFTEINGTPMHTCFVDGLDVNVYATQKVR